MIARYVIARVDRKTSIIIQKIVAVHHVRVRCRDDSVVARSPGASAAAKCGYIRGAWSYSYVPVPEKCCAQ